MLGPRNQPGDIDGQIYARDFKLFDQSDMIVSLVPELPGGVPGLSSGVERELQHVFEASKEVYVVWKPRRNPSPFITKTATKVSCSTAEALEHFEAEGMFRPASLFGHGRIRTRRPRRAQRGSCSRSG